MRIYLIKFSISAFTPCYFSPLSEIPGSIELLENSLTYEEVQWRKIVECLFTEGLFIEFRCLLASNLVPLCLHKAPMLFHYFPYIRGVCKDV